MEKYGFLCELIIIWIFAVWVPYSKRAKVWSGDSSMTAVQGESVTMTWTVNLMASDAGRLWDYVKISQANQDASTEELVTYRQTNVKIINNPNYQNRSSDLMLNVSQTGLVVTIVLTIANLTRATDMKDYKAVLGFKSADASTYSGFTTLTILVKPHSTEFTIHPDKNAFCLKDLVNLACKANAVPNDVDYSLYLNNHLVKKRYSIGTFSVSLKDKGEYDFQCVPSNVAGIGLTRSIKVFVKEPPKITRCRINDEDVTSKAVKEGTEVTLSCELSGSEPFSISWNKEREQNHLSQKNSLTFRSINRNDSGKYHVTVYSGKECEKTLTKTLQLTVNYLDEPEVSGKRYHVISSENNEALFKVTIYGNPLPAHLKCRREGGPGDVFDARQESESKATFFVSIRASEDVEYYCDVENAVENRLIKFQIYKRIPPTLIYGTFTFAKFWTEELIANEVLSMKNMVTEALDEVYASEEFVSTVHVSRLEELKGSVVVSFNLKVIANVPDPLKPLKNAVNINEKKRKLNRFVINRNSIKQKQVHSNDASKNEDDLTVEVESTIDRIIDSVGIGKVVAFFAGNGTLGLLLHYCCKGKSASRNKKCTDVALYSNGSMLQSYANYPKFGVEGSFWNTTTYTRYSPDGRISGTETKFSFLSFRFLK